MALCYRQEYHNKTDTTISVEAFHNVLKTTYLKRIPNRSVDDLVDLLLPIEFDYFVRLDASRDLTTARNSRGETDQRHHRGMQILDGHVIEIFPGHWTIKSQSIKGDQQVPISTADGDVDDLNGDISSGEANIIDETLKPDTNCI